MAIRRSAAASGNLAAHQQIFKPKDTIAKFSKLFPAMYVGFGLVLVASVGLAVWLNMWLIPVMAVVPMVSVIATGLYAKKLMSARVVIDAERIRVFQGKQATLSLAWHQITRLTIRQVQDGAMYELWVKDKATPLMADFFVDGDKLLKAVSARTSLSWETL